MAERLRAEGVQLERGLKAHDSVHHVEGQLAALAEEALVRPHAPIRAQASRAHRDTSPTDNTRVQYEIKSGHAPRGEAMHCCTARCSK